MKSETTNWLPVIDNSKLKHVTKMNNFILHNTIGHIESSLHIYPCRFTVNFYLWITFIMQVFLSRFENRNIAAKNGSPNHSIKIDLEPNKPQPIRVVLIEFLD